MALFRPGSDSVYFNGITPGLLHLGRSLSSHQRHAPVGR